MKSNDLRMENINGKHQETDTLKDQDRQYHSPSERVALVILGITGFFRDMFTAPTRVIPRGRVVQHQGESPAAGIEPRYPNILLVEDDPARAEEFIETIKKYYLFGKVKIFVAHAYDAARTFFANEPINLVIMDADLDDDAGDGAMLTREFLNKAPELTILANSSRKIFNMKLTGLGAKDVLGKKTEKLQNWLKANDPAGSKG